MAKTFRLRRLEPPEGPIQKTIMSALAFEVGAGRVIWYGRFNSGRIWVPGQDKGIYPSIKYMLAGEETTRGFPDIAGQLSDGRAFYFEVKAKGKRATKEQARFIYHATRAGGIGGIVNSADAAIKMIREAFDER